MANAMIEESGRNAFSCRKTRADGEFVDSIKQTFDDAVEHEPSIVFLDDMDKFAQDNTDSNSNKEEFVVIQSCLEDIKDKDVFVIATANDIDNLPSSLVRAGRFGKQLWFAVPPLDDSRKIIAHYLSGKKVAADVDAEMIANILVGHSCAVLENVINEAGIYAAFEKSEYITKDHLVKAILRVVLKTVEDDAGEEILVTIDDDELERVSKVFEENYEDLILD
jgi:cell division protease FtsH